ncbi:sterol desaturase family protein [Novosphingobium mathurense]|uniref:Fatty acid hydroxylase superfamily protein n=1 Tax=Novosphingobium mathurense TaxID=428990 RepID=A0A1U6GVU8_9SPHN|nr:hypothetical protein [Novosphingobium mathurense]SLJ87614.1 hypothetical protein SAMN06295987_101626 [Novosphingobium mathurense]
MIDQALHVIDKVPFLLLSYVTVLVFGTAICASAVLHGQDRFSLRGLLRTCFPPEFYLSRSTAHDCVLWTISKLLTVSQRYVPLVVSAIIITQFLDYMAGPERGVDARIHAGVAITALVLIFAYSGLFNKVITTVTLDPLRHSHFPIGLGPFDRIFISPHMHQVHHSKLVHHWDRNLATNLALLDWIFGTAYRPGKGEMLVYGIGAEADDRQFTSLKGILVDPVVNMGRLIFAGLRTGRLAAH